MLGPNVDQISYVWRPSQTHTIPIPCTIPCAPFVDFISVYGETLLIAFDEIDAETAELVQRALHMGGGLIQGMVWYGIGGPQAQNFFTT